MQFKKRKPTDLQQVHKVSAWLGVSEFQVFCNAWQAWYDEIPLEKRIEPFFIEFLGQAVVPFWVRNSSVLSHTISHFSYFSWLLCGFFITRKTGKFRICRYFFYSNADKSSRMCPARGKQGQAAR